ncbi:hypothetical protein Tco_0769808 [Tanacetum coccineum]|uniref:Uncharacterized protein n=1 Tax=Tanacetum coccineum TaxID=301880 RepID=A0ABQ4ZDC8_9ASTR
MKLILTEIGLVKISTSVLVEIALPVLVKVIPPIEIEMVWTVSDEEWAPPQVNTQLDSTACTGAGAELEQKLVLLVRACSDNFLKFSTSDENSLGGRVCTYLGNNCLARVENFGLALDDFLTFARASCSKSFTCCGVQ